VLLAPPGSRHTRAALHILAGAEHPLLPAAASEPGVVVLADCGRVDPGTPAEAIARQADALVLLTGTRAEDLAHTAARLSELARWTPRPGLLLTGDGYPTAEVERELGIPAIGRLPHDPPAVATLPGRRPLFARRSRTGGLARHVGALARTLASPTSAVRKQTTTVASAENGMPARDSVSGATADLSDTDLTSRPTPPPAGQLPDDASPSAPAGTEPRT
jgi:hypothetical protein